MSVLPANDPVYFEVSGNGKELAQEVQVIKDSCRNLIIPDEVCISALSDYFTSEPIWVSHHNQNRFFISARLSASSLNKRGIKVPYAFDDYSIARLPRWGDIFDDANKDRFLIVSQALKENACRSLDSLKGGIQRDLNELCEAEELFKYATYLDACITNLVRVKQMAMRRPTSVHPSIYVKSYFREIWISQMCQNGSMVPFAATFFDDPDYEPAEPPLSPRDIADAFKTTHDQLLRIAAKAGDEWAMVSYLPRNESNEYWKDLFDQKPALAHRYVASLTPGLTQEERLHHLAAAHKLQMHANIDRWLFVRSNMHVDAELRKLKHVLDRFGSESSLVYPWQISASR